MPVLEVIEIGSLDLEELAIYRTLKQQAAHREQGLFVAEGPKVIERLLDSRLELVSFLGTADWLAHFHARLESRRERVRVYLAEKPLLETLVGFPLFQGALACAKIPRSRSLEEILDSSPKEWPVLLAALDGVTNPENLGVLVRVCVGLKADALIVGETSASPYLRRSVRNSMGNIFNCNIIETPSLTETLQLLQKRGVQCLAAHLDPRAVPITQCDFRPATCLVFGHEGRGVSEKTASACGRKVIIPMPSRVDSLNVSSAASILLYEACRQRGVI